MGTFESNHIESRGIGEWIITTYNPSKPFGPYIGELVVSKDFHSIYNHSKQDKFCLASFPNQNVAAVENNLK